MRTFNLSEKNILALKSILMADVCEVAEDTVFLKEAELDFTVFRDYIDERIEICKKFEMDFWNIVDVSSSDYILRRLQAVYAGKKVDDFNKSYEPPDSKTNSKNFLKALMKIPPSK